ncbi:hypothetical protein PCO31110_00079 [Pandoraea communis]|uniref:Uncharacterized protein n=1 Tax=Pandoraea communis TaxID=2508297 RepID=A0A5E4RBJ0_9BURK|nr:hypothetical protein PCO31110_00079 [Pandoraea communis]
MEIRSIRAHRRDIDVAQGGAGAQKSPVDAGLGPAGRRGPLRVSCSLCCCSAGLNYSAATGILPILACHSFGPVWCTDTPVESTATVTGMSLTSNS